MRNLKSVHRVTTEDLLKSQLEGFLGANLSSIHSRKQFQIFSELKGISGKINKAKVRGMLKLSLSVIYSMALVYFLTILLL